MGKSKSKPKGKTIDERCAFSLLPTHASARKGKGGSNINYLTESTRSVVESKPTSNNLAASGAINKRVFFPYTVT